MTSIPRSAGSGRSRRHGAVADEFSAKEQQAWHRNGERGRGVSAGSLRRDGLIHRVSDMARQNISSGSPFEPQYGFSRAVKVGDRVLLAGTAPIWPDGDVDPDPKVQAHRCLEVMIGALVAAGGRPEDVVRTRTFITDASFADEVGEAHGEVFGSIRPVATMVVVAGLLDDRWKVEMELEAVLTG